MRFYIYPHIGSTKVYTGVKPCNNEIFCDRCFLLIAREWYTIVHFYWIGAKLLSRNYSSICWQFSAEHGAITLVEANSTEHAVEEIADTAVGELPRKDELLQMSRDNIIFLNTLPEELCAFYRFAIFM